MRIRELLNRIGERVDGVDIAEVIIATDPNTEGEATATYLVRMLRDIPGLTVTRIASGLPMGGDLEFADELTLGRALVRPPRDGLILVSPKPTHGRRSASRSRQYVDLGAVSDPATTMSYSPRRCVTRRTRLR